MKQTISLAIFILIYFYLQAQDTSSIYDFSLIELAQIKTTTSTRKTVSAYTAPGNIIIITHQDIKANNYTSLRDLLNDIPQIIIQHQASAENEDIYTINGITGNEKFLLLLNGIRINSTAGTDITIGESYSLKNIKQVEVILNPSSVLYGADAFSAIINLITFSIEENQGIDFNIYRGNYNTINTAFSANYKYKNLGFSILYKYYYSDEPFMPIFYPDLYQWFYYYQQTGKVIRFDDTINSPVGILPWNTYTQAYNFRTKLLYKNFEFGFMRFYESHSTAYTDKPENAIYCKNARYNTVLTNLYFKHSINNKNKSLKVNSLIFGQEFIILPNSAFINQYTGFYRAYKYEKAKSIRWEENLEINIKKDIPLNLGFTAEFYDIIPKTGDLPKPYDITKPYNQQNIYYFGTNLQDTSGNSLIIYQDIYRIKYYNFSIYSQIMHKFSKKIYLTLGLRKEINSRYGNTFIPRFSFVFLPNKLLSIKFFYGKSFLAPSAHKAYQHFGSFKPVTDSLGRTIGLISPFFRLTNPYLKPEYKDSYEISFTKFFNDNFFIKTNLFFNKLSNLITYNFINDTVFHNVPVEVAMIPQNRSEGKTYGATISSKTKFKIAFFKCTYNINYTYINGIIQGQKLDYTPNHSVKTSLNIQYLNFFNFVVGSEYRSKATLYTNITSPPYILFYSRGNALIFENNSNKVYISFKAMNIFNKHYFNLTDGTFGLKPQKPISLLIGLKAEF